MQWLEQTRPRDDEKHFHSLNLVSSLKNEIVKSNDPTEVVNAKEFTTSAVH